MTSQSGLAAPHRDWLAAPRGAGRATGWIEASLGGALLVVAILTDIAAASPPGRYVVSVTLCLTAAASGHYPRAAAVGTAALLAGVVALPLQFEGLAVHATLIVVFALGRLGLRRSRAVATLAYLVLLGLTTFRLDLGTVQTSLYLLAWLVMFGIAWAVGGSFHQLVVNEREARRVALREQRLEIARELHDLVAQGLTQISMRVEQARLEGRTSDDLDMVERLSHRSAQGLRTMMSMLRDGDGDGDPDPGPPDAIGPAQGVVDDATVELREHGFEPIVAVEGDVTAVPARVAPVFSRVVREATANIIRHGDPTRPCAIMLDVGARHLEAVFVNGPARRRPGGHQGVGIQGMKERVAALGGTVYAGEGGSQWITQVFLPFP